MLSSDTPIIDLTETSDKIEEFGNTCPECGKNLASESGMKTHYNKVHGRTLSKKKIKIKFECDQCGREATKKLFHYEEYDHNFYSKRCFGQYKTEKGHVEFKCDHCGEEAAKVRNKYNEDGNNFCSTVHRKLEKLKWRRYALDRSLEQRREERGEGWLSTFRNRFTGDGS